MMQYVIVEFHLLGWLWSARGKKTWGKTLAPVAVGVGQFFVLLSSVMLISIVQQNESGGPDLLTGGPH